MNAMYFLYMQGDVLSRLKGCAHLVKMLGRGTCSYAGKTWTAMLLLPMAHKLKCSDSLMLFCQVCDTVIVASMKLQPACVPRCSCI